MHPDRQAAYLADRYGLKPRGKPRTVRTWWAAISLAVVLGATCAVPLLYLAYLWVLVVPLWLLVMLIAAIACFISGRGHPRAVAYGVGVLLSIPIGIGLPIAYIAVVTAVG